MTPISPGTGLFQEVLAEVPVPHFEVDVFLDDGMAGLTEDGGEGGKAQIGFGGEPVRRAKKVALKESYSIDRDLNLRGDENDIPPFRKFVDEKTPASAQEFNTVSVYYLKKLLNLPAVTLNHVYTCYAEAKKKPPEHFKQSLTDTKNKRGT